ncbi:MerR family DNA-binding transcriptional regulator [Pseudomonas allii]|uniref:MerR family DNA-binding transcriptional regulator n=1 Tax=Pseudomonas allii TaxID=2740531 RepID=UPI003CC679D7
MDISEVARRTGLPSSTVRFYEKVGLITATSAPGERRHFRPAVLDQSGRPAACPWMKSAACCPSRARCRWTGSCCWIRQTASTRPSSA